MYYCWMILSDFREVLEMDEILVYYMVIFNFKFIFLYYIVLKEDVSIRMYI